MMINSTLRVMATFAALQLATFTAFADQAPDCFGDSDCEDGSVCAQEDCVSLEQICIDSSQCIDGTLCDRGRSGCPFTCRQTTSGEKDPRCPDRCAQPAGTCSTVTCSADADCPEDQLCGYSTTQCAEGDAVCEAAPPLGCLSFVRFCGDANPDLPCPEGQICNSEDRCVLPDGEEASQMVLVDEGKAQRLRTDWTRSTEENERTNENGGEDTEGGETNSTGASSDSGCHVSNLGRSGGTRWWVLLTLGMVAPLLLRRQRSR